MKEKEVVKPCQLSTLVATINIRTQESTLEEKKLQKNIFLTLD